MSQPPCRVGSAAADSPIGSIVANFAEGFLIHVFTLCANGRHCRRKKILHVEEKENRRVAIPFSRRMLCSGEG